MSVVADIRQPRDQAEKFGLYLERILRPLIRLFVGKISCNFILNLVKEIYLDEARAWIQSGHSGTKRVTRSKLAMLSGLDTRTIKSLEENKTSKERLRQINISAETGVLHAWSFYPEYIDENKQPKIIPISGGAGSFQGIVMREVGRNVTPRTVLDHLIESGNVEVVDNNFVRMKSRFYEPARPSQLTVLNAGSTAIARLCETVLHNLSEQDSSEKRVQQLRWSKYILEDDYPRVSRQIRKLLTENIQAITQILDDTEVSGRHKGVKEIGVGWFAFG